MNVALEGFANVFQLGHILLIIGGTLLGIVIGALPGLSGALGVALFIPITFTMTPEAGLIVLVAIYCGSIFGGSVSAILISTPGTPAASATLIDGFPMTQKGLANKALSTATVSSFVGGILSAIPLYLLAPVIGLFALKFGPADYFWLAIFGLTMIAGVSTGSVLKGLISGAIGLAIALVGLDPITGAERFTLGIPELTDGVPFTPALIGLFAIGQVLLMAEKKAFSTEILKTSNKIDFSFREFWDIKYTLLRSSGIGAVVGAIPAAGATIAAFISYNVTKQFSRNRKQIGTGHYEGVAACESANNAVTGTSLIPTLALGIPGESVTAVLLGGLIIQGLKPGPDLFTVHADITYTVFAGFVLINVAILLIGLFGSRYAVYVTKVPTEVLIPFIFTLSVIGTYSLNSNMFDVYVMILFGILGYLFLKFDFNRASIVLALYLGPIAESGLRRSLVLHDDSLLTALFDSSISVTIAVLALLALFTPIVLSKLQGKKAENKVQTQA